MNTKFCVRDELLSITQQPLNYILQPNQKTLITGIVDALRDPEWGAREAAINRLVEHCKYYHWSDLTCSTMTVAEFHDEIRMAIPGIMACLIDSAWRVRQAAINGLSNLAVHRMCYLFVPV